MSTKRVISRPLCLAISIPSSLPWTAGDELKTLEREKRRSISVLRRLVSFSPSLLALMNACLVPRAAECDLEFLKCRIIPSVDVRLPPLVRDWNTWRISSPQTASSLPTAPTLAKGANSPTCRGFVDVVLIYRGVGPGYDVTPLIDTMAAS